MANCSQSHPVHEHEHELKWKRYSKPYFCSGCKEKGFGPRYKCHTCEYELHKHCKEASRPTAKHSFYKREEFIFLEEPPTGESARYCDACGEKVTGFVYHSQKNRDFHPCCFHLKADDFKCGDAEFQLLNKSLTSKCMWCHRKKLNDRHDTKIQGWSYVSKCKKYQFHAYCTTEMLVEAWKATDQNSLALKLNSLVVAELSERKRRKSGTILKVLKLFLKAIACALIGDPALSLGLFAIENLT